MLIKWWQGTDALKLYMYPPGKKIWYVRIFLERIFWRLFHRFFTHWANTDKLSPYLQRYGIKAIVKPMPINQSIYEKKPHIGFNVLFYLPESKDGNQKYKDWIYGRDIFAGLIECGFDFIHVDGTANMVETMPLIDCYLKINRHPGSDLNRIAKECMLNDIPVIVSNYKLSDAENIKLIGEKINELGQNKSFDRPRQKLYAIT